MKNECASGNDEVNFFAGRMPLTLTGVLITWHFLYNRLNLPFNEACEIDPWSIFLHCILRMCPNISSTAAQIKSLIGSFFSVRLKLLFIMPQIEEEKIQREKRVFFDNEE